MSASFLLLGELLAGLSALLLAALALPVVVFCVQTLLAGVLGVPRRGDDRADPSRLQDARPSMAVIVPAHNEASGIAATLADLLAQRGPGDRILVVADNCTDATAQIAREAGAEVTERFDALRRGKGYALDHGLRHLAPAPPEVVLIVDADCRIAEGALQRLARRATAEQRPIQASYLMRAPAGAGVGLRIATFAMVVKNRVRPLGSAWLGLPCQLTGSGMAFPWAVLQRVSLASGHIVEDMQLGTELALAGAAPRFEPDAQVMGEFPLSSAGAATQRTRWEHGHLQVLLGQAPRLLARGVRRADLAAMALAADLLVPPLALLVMALCAALGLSGLAAALGASTVPLASALAALAAVGAGVGLAWWRFGRHTLALADLLRVPFYMAGKLPVYLGFVVARQSEWVRTRRRGE